MKLLLLLQVILTDSVQAVSKMKTKRKGEGFWVTLPSDHDQNLCLVFEKTNLAGKRVQVYVMRIISTGVLILGLSRIGGSHPLWNFAQEGATLLLT